MQAEASARELLGSGVGEVCGRATDDDRIALPSEITSRVLGELLCISTRQFRHARQAIGDLKIGESGIEFDGQELREKIVDGFAKTA